MFLYETITSRFKKKKLDIHVKRFIDKNEILAFICFKVIQRGGEIKEIKLAGTGLAAYLNDSVCLACINP